MCMHPFKLHVAEQPCIISVVHFHISTLTDSAIDHRRKLDFKIFIEGTVSFHVCSKRYFLARLHKHTQREPNILTLKIQDTGKQ